MQIISQGGKKIMPEDLKIGTVLHHLIISNIKPLKSETKWQERLRMTNQSSWRKIWSRSYSNFSSVKAKQLQFKFLHNVLFTEDRLVHLGLSNGQCCICKNTQETITHLFYECFYAKVFINMAQDMVNKIEDRSKNNTQINLDLENWSLGVSKYLLSDLVNTVIFETKWHIWLYRNNCKHKAEIQNIDKYKFLLKYQIKDLLKCVISKFPNVLDYNFISAL